MSGACSTCGHPEDAHEVGGGACHANAFASGASECTCPTYVAPVDPSTPEREAREEVLETMLSGNDTGIEYYPGPSSHRWLADRERCQRENAAMLDAYAATVRARALADVAGWVEAEPKVWKGQEGLGGVWLVNSDALLAKLREAK